MKDGWFERLSEVISNDPRSMRALSLEAGLGPNFISQMFKNKKDPGGERLFSILSKLDQSAIAFIFLGIRISADGLEMLGLYSELPEKARDQFRGLLLSLSHGAETPSP